MTDLEKAREESIEEEPLLTFFATGQPTIGAYSQNSLRNQFEAGAEWKEQQMIKKAIKWLDDWFTNDSCKCSIPITENAREEFFNDFKQAMKEK